VVAPAEVVDGREMSDGGGFNLLITPLADSSYATGLQSHRICIGSLVRSVTILVASSTQDRVKAITIMAGLSSTVRPAATSKSHDPTALYPSKTSHSVS